MALATEGDCSSIETAGMDGVTPCEKAHALCQGTALAAEVWLFNAVSATKNKLISV